MIDFQRDKLSVGVGLAAAFVGLMTDDTKWVDGALAAARAQAAARVLRFFAEAIARREAHLQKRTKRKRKRQPPPPPPPPVPTVDELTLANETLGVTAAASQNEVKARRRALAKEWHPDRFASDRSKEAEAGIRMQQINAAWSVICEAKGW